MFVAMMSAVLIATPAHAHHTTVTGSVACGTGGAWVITWRVENWDGAGTATVTGSSRVVVPTGTTIGNGAAKTFTETVTSAATISLGVDARWSNGATASNSGRVLASAFPTDCAPPDVEVTAAEPSVVDPTCAADGRLVVPADTAGLRYTQSPAGSGPGTYTVTATAKPGHILVGTRSWTLTVRPQLSGRECLTEVTPVAPSVQVIEGCGTYGSVTLPQTVGVRYELVEGDGREGAWKVVATALPGYVLTDGLVAVWSGDLGERTECPVVVTPVAPSATLVSACETPGSLSLAETEGIAYELVAGDGLSGLWEVVATALPGFVLAEDAVASWSGDLGAFKECGVLGEEEEAPGDDQETGGDKPKPAADVKGIQEERETVLPNTGASAALALTGGLSLLLLAAGTLLLRRRPTGLG
ncbi:hypothetical protein GCM10009668_29720 [Nocardioides dubius]|uniref:Gram-positive cocci surface proteins LPxTG domain-containing protein n=1 Tax=Nocardioides dubius TaxID=317019 RepID=A0ABN1TXL4_9ACTN